MAREVDRPVRLPPRWFVRTAWKAHRGLYRVTNGRKGLWTPANKRGWGALRLTTIGRRSGRDRGVIIGYLEDGPNLVVVAMNGWGEGEPAWWLNLQAQPTATVRLVDSPPKRVSARVAHGPERDRLWALWRTIEPRLDEYAALRSTSTTVIVLEPVPPGF